MSLFIEMSAMVAALALVAMAAATVRAMIRIDRAAAQFDRLTVDVQQWVVQANALTVEARAAVASAREAIAPIGRVVNRFEVVGERTADLSAAVLAELAPPLRAAIGITRGMKAVSAYFLERWIHRFTHSRSTINGGSNNE
jgi:hypothetical protein